MTQRVERIFSDVVALWGERTAIEVGNRRIGYEDLDRRSNRLARRLIDAGAGRGKIVGVAAGNIERFAIAALATLKTGAAYLPVDTRYPVERARDILIDAQPTILLSDPDFPAELIPAGLPVIHDFWNETTLKAFGDDALDVPGGVDDTACVYYTSGSTGRPKGIEVAHRGIPSLVGDRDFLPFGPDDRIAQAANFAFDAITFELWGALLNGGCVVHIPKGTLFSAPAIAEFFELQQITVVWLTTSLFNALSTSQPTAFGALKTLVIGGEAADPAPIGKVLRSSRPPVRLVNAYGPTEATTFASWHAVTLADVDAALVPIGKPILNTSLHILDVDLKPVQADEAGELYIGGLGVANGYLHQPELTSERFIPDPLGSSGHLYRSGDLCRKLKDGNIDYLGRMDDQIKIRGFRVEPSEVVATLRNLPGVDDAVVLARDASFGSKELIALVKGQNLPPIENLRQELATLVPDYMVPSIIRGINEFPLTSNGKLDRGALLKYAQFGAADSKAQAQTSEIEKRVLLAWKNILRRDDIRINQDFRELGGDSLSMMNLALELEGAFDVRLSPDDLASPLTISRLSEVLNARIGDDHDAAFSLCSGIQSSKVFAISYPWTRSLMPEEIGQALSGGRWRHLHVPFSAFRSNNAITIPEMASYLEQQIYSFAPQGPYVLYGHCFTGLLAYEVGQRLTDAGHTVSLIVIVDSYPSANRTRLGKLRTFSNRAVRFAKLDWRSKLAGVRQKLPLRVENRIFEDFIREACVRAVDDYRPRPYDGRVVFFRHSHDPSLIAKDQNAWRKLVRGWYEEYAVSMHDQGRVTAESVTSGMNEVSAKLRELSIS